MFYPAQHFIWSSLHKQASIYSLDVLLSQFWTSRCSMSDSNYCFLTCTRISQEIGQVVLYSHLFKNFPQFVMIHTEKGLSVVTEAEGPTSALLEFSCFFYDSADVDNLISGSSAFSKFNFNIWKFSVHILLKPSLEDFEHYLANMWNEHNCTHLMC